MITVKLPSYPWLKIGSDLFELNGTTCVLAVSYFSRCIEVVKMTSTSSMVIIEKLKSKFPGRGFQSLWSVTMGLNTPLMKELMGSPISPRVQDTHRIWPSRKGCTKNKETPLKVPTDPLLSHISHKPRSALK